MRRWPGEVLRIGVGHDSLALVKTHRLFGARRTLLAETRVSDAGEPEELARGLRTLFSDAPVAGLPLVVVVADELARMWQVAPPPGAASPADLEAAAAMRYQSLFGAAPAGWTIAADWQAAQPFLAAALPAALLDVVNGCAREAGCHAVDIAPQFVAAMNGWRNFRRPGAWFGLVHGQVLTLAAYDGALLAALRSAVVPPGADRAWLDSHVAREALRIGIERPQRLQLCGTAPRSWGSGAGRTTFDCTLLDGDSDSDSGNDNSDDNAGRSGAVRLACTGSRT